MASDWVAGFSNFSPVEMGPVFRATTSAKSFFLNFQRPNALAGDPGGGDEMRQGTAGLILEISIHCALKKSKLLETTLYLNSVLRVVWV